MRDTAGEFLNVADRRSEALPGLGLEGKHPLSGGTSLWISTVLGQNARMDLGLKDRVYVVTRGSRGLGFAGAKALLEEGANVVVASPHEATASAAADQLAQSSTAAKSPTWIVADNADRATPSRLIAAAKESYGRLDGALISVGGTPTGSVASTTDDAWRAAFESVFLGATRLARDLAAELGSKGTGRRAGTGASLVFVWLRPFARRCRISPSQTAYSPDSQAS